MGAIALRPASVAERAELRDWLGQSCCKPGSMSKQGECWSMLSFLVLFQYTAYGVCKPVEKKGKE